MKRRSSRNGRQYPFKTIFLGGACICGLIYACLYSLPLQVQEARPGRRVFAISTEDLVLAMPSDEDHLPLIQASWPSRKGIRTVVAVNDSQLAEAFNSASGQWQESWVTYPDDEPLRAKYRGDTRAALAPFLAHQVYGETYKWLLYGDDDTLWFVDGVLKLLKDIDPDMPYLLTDNLWWSDINGTIGRQPNIAAPRKAGCSEVLFCPDPQGQYSMAEGAKAFTAPEGCPCTPQLLCQSAEPGYFDSECSIPRHLVPAYSTRTYSMHGGAGAIISIGLLRAVKLEDMERCIADVASSTGGDAFLTICLWRLGFAHTDPGPSIADPSRRLFDAADAISIHELADMLFQAADGLCDNPICQEPSVLDSMVSKHVHSRQAGSMGKAAEAMILLTQAYQAYIDSRPA